MPLLEGQGDDEDERRDSPSGQSPKEPRPGEEDIEERQRGGRPVQDPVDDQTRGENRKRQGMKTVRCRRL